MTRPCYHCARNDAQPHSNFCAQCSGTNRPLFYPTDRRSNAARKAKTGLLYLGATLALGWLAYKTVEFVLTP